MRALGPGRMIHHNHEQLAPWRDTVGWHAKAHCPKDWDSTGPMFVQATFWLPRPKSHYRTNGELKPVAQWWPITRPDTDKLTRALLDALTLAGVWVDDSQVVQLTAEKSYGGPPRTWCAITKLSERTTE